MLEHGGRVRTAAARYGIAIGDWLDLSTGINPCGYPPPPVPSAHWLRLPEDDDGLEAAAAAYYGSPALLPVAGSQAAIQALPAVLGKAFGAARVGIIAPSYAEHTHAWRHANLQTLAAGQIEATIDRLDVLLLVHPNNPSAQCWRPAQLRDWHRRLAARGGWLVIDEAFIDATPELSLAADAGQPGLVILRSLGKFFGLAGARVGFVLAGESVRHALRETLGPWTLSGPARCVATAALRDAHWQASARERLHRDGERLGALLDRCGLAASSGCALFHYLQCDDAAALHHALARQGVLVRLFDQPAALRFGLPASEHEWSRLATALTDAARQRRPTRR